MGNSGSVSLPATADRRKDILVGWFQIGDSEDCNVEEWTVEFQMASKMFLTAGKEVSYAIFNVPLLSASDERAFTVALKANGPLGNAAIKPRTRGTIYWYNADRLGTPILCGTAMNIGHALKNDVGTITLLDDKAVLETITCFGRIVYDPRDLEPAPKFIADDPFILNRFGLQDCMDVFVNGLYVPCFAPEPRFGWTISDTTEPAPGDATARARSWRIPDLLNYIYQFYHSDNEDSRPAAIADYGHNNIIPSFIYWPAGLEQQLSLLPNSGFGDRLNRPLLDFDCENKDMATVLQSAADAAGPFGLYTKPRGSSSMGGYMQDQCSTDSELSFVNFSIRQGGTQIYVPNMSGTGLDAGINVIDGHIQESVRNYRDEAILVGNAPRFEKTLVTGMPENNGNLEGITTHDAGWLQFIYENYNRPILGKLIELANSFYPLAWIAFRIAYLYDYTIGTKWESYTPSRHHAKILPHLLSSDVSDDSNPQNWSPRPIIVEYNDGDWKPLPAQNGLELSLDGSYFTLPILRLGTESDGFYGFSKNPYQASAEEFNPSNPDCLKRKDIRVCLAIQADWRITGWANGDPNSAEARVNSNKFRSSYTHVTKDGDYSEWLRGPGAKPFGGDPLLATANSTNFPDKCTENNELFSDAPGPVNQPTSGARLPTHAEHRLRDVKRIEYTGQLMFDAFDPGLLPGTIIDGVKNGEIDVRGAIKSVALDEKQTGPLVEMG